MARTHQDVRRTAVHRGRQMGGPRLPGHRYASRNGGRGPVHRPAHTEGGRNGYRDHPSAGRSARQQEIRRVRRGDQDPDHRHHREHERIRLPPLRKGHGHIQDRRRRGDRQGDEHPVPGQGPDRARSRPERRLRNAHCAQGSQIRIRAGLRGHSRQDHQNGRAI